MWNTHEKSSQKVSSSSSDLFIHCLEWCLKSSCERKILASFLTSSVIVPRPWWRIQADFNNRQHNYHVELPKTQITFFTFMRSNCSVSAEQLQIPVIMFIRFLHFSFCFACGVTWDFSVTVQQYIFCVNRTVRACRRAASIFRSLIWTYKNCYIGEKLNTHTQKAIKRRTEEPGGTLKPSLLVEHKKCCQYKKSGKL